MNAIWRAARLLVLVYVSWLLMLALHEAGHVMHAYASGGRVRRVSTPLLGFSETFYSRNPHPQFVAWGGPVWGAILPLLGLVAARRGTVRRYAQFFAGFCLIANGAYIGIGWINRAGDAGDLLRYGAPVWALVVFGLASCALGLWLWHCVSNEAKQIPLQQ